MLSMAKRSNSKLNRLQRELPDGLLADSAWMEARGYSSALRSQYVSAGWLDSPTRRVYRRSRTPLTWQQVVISLQTLLDRPLAVGGRTALEQQGYAHYLPATIREVHLYGPKRPPTWLATLPLDVTFIWHNSLRLFPIDAASMPEPSTVMISAADVITRAVLDNPRTTASCWPVSMRPRRKLCDEPVPAAAAAPAQGHRCHRHPHRRFAQP